MRTNFSSSDLSEVLPEDIEAKCKEVAEISMGVEVSDEDMANIVELCDQVILEISYGCNLCFICLKYGCVFASCSNKS